VAEILCPKAGKLTKGGGGKSRNGGGGEKRGGGGASPGKARSQSVQENHELVGLEGSNKFPREGRKRQGLSGKEEENFRFGKNALGGDCKSVVVARGVTGGGLGSSGRKGF